MQNWIIDRETRMLPSWQEAMPDARLITREHAVTVPEAPGILWCRQRPDEAVASVLAGVARQAGQAIVLLCDAPDEAVVMQALAAGAAGCCNTHAAPEVLRQVALVVNNGGLWVGQSLLQRLVGSTSRLLAEKAPVTNDDWSHLLSEREVQVARQVAGGASNKEIAGQLEITERTVKAHLTAIFEKLGLRDRLQLSLRINGLAI
jgi:DNA-binding NarL/FixJ family response regulator